MSKELRILDVELGASDEHLKPLIEEFNRIAVEGGYYPDIIGWDHYKLFQYTLPSTGLTPQDWKKFRQHSKIKQWYDDELELQIRSTASQLVKNMSAGDGRSTGQAQALNSVLAFLDKKDRTESTTKIIYNFIPLTKYEEENPEIKKLNFIPPEIDNAIQVIRRTPKKGEE